MLRERCSCTAEIDGATQEEVREWRKAHKHEFGQRPEGGGASASIERKVGFFQAAPVPGDYEA